MIITQRYSLHHAILYWGALFYWARELLEKRRKSE